MKKYLEPIKQSHLFDQMNDQDILIILDKLNAAIKEYQDNEYLYHTTDYIHDIGIVLTGKIHMLSVDFWGKTFIFAEYSEGSLFGESHSLTPDEPLMFDILAVGKTVVLNIPIRNILSLIYETTPLYQKINKNLLKIIAKKKISFLHKIDHLSRKTLRDKIISYLTVQSRIHASEAFDLPFSRQEMADYLSADRSALSQELSKMKKEGLIDFKHNRFELKNHDIFND